MFIKFTGSFKWCLGKKIPFFPLRVCYFLNFSAPADVDSLHNSQLGPAWKVFTGVGTIILSSQAAVWQRQQARLVLALKPDQPSRSPNAALSSCCSRSCSRRTLCLKLSDTHTHTNTHTHTHMLYTCTLTLSYSRCCSLWACHPFKSTVGVSVWYALRVWVWGGFPTHGQQLLLLSG